jgi:TM2 domain-containing membrane protein YozV
MSNALKGLLFSALVFPGAGQILLTRYLRGGVFFALAFVSGILCVTGIVRQAVVILQDLVAKGEVITTPKVMSIVADISTYASSLFLKIALLIFLCCWLASVVDAWLIGRKMDAGPSVVEDISER